MLNIDRLRKSAATPQILSKQSNRPLGPTKSFTAGGHPNPNQSSSSSNTPFGAYSGSDD